VNALETGKYDPSLALAFRVSKLFKQPIEAIFKPDSDESNDSLVPDTDRAPG
jgi:putative transcriptional regulator